MSNAIAIVLFFLLLFINALFVASEFALVSSRKDRLEHLADSGHSRARTVIAAGEHLSMMLATCQLGITIASVLLGKLAEPAIALLLERPLALMSIKGMWLHTLSFVIALAIVTYLHVLLGEMIPKNLTIAGPERVAMVLIPPMVIVMKVAKPLIMVFNWIANITLKLVFRVTPRDELETSVTTAQLKSMIGESRGEGLLDQEENIRLDRVLEASDRPVSTVTIPLQHMRAIMLDEGVIPLSTLQKIVADTGYSRYPVVNDAGSYIGFVHIKDVLAYVYDPSLADKPVPANVIRPLASFPSDTTIDSASTRMQRLHSHLALVTDVDTDALTGFVALEDLMEQFVGTVRDSTHKIPE